MDARSRERVASAGSAMTPEETWTARAVLEAIAKLLRNESVGEKSAANGALALIEMWEEKGKR